MRDILIVDGYNIINSWAELKDMQNINLEAARDTLLRIMEDYSGYSGMEVWLVYDAYMVKNSSPRDERINGVRVVFTVNGDTADAFIEREVNLLAEDRRMRFRVRVATNDRLEQGMILGLGAARMSARELYEEVNLKRADRDRNYTGASENREAKLLGRLDSKTLERLGRIGRKPEEGNNDR